MVEGGRVLAMVTYRDVIARVVAAGQDPSALRASYIATKIPPALVAAQRGMARLAAVDHLRCLDGAAVPPTIRACRL